MCRTAAPAENRTVPPPIKGSRNTRPFFIGWDGFIGMSRQVNEQLRSFGCDSAVERPFQELSGERRLERIKAAVQRSRIVTAEEPYLCRHRLFEHGADATDRLANTCFVFDQRKADVFVTIVAKTNTWRHCYLGLVKHKA